MTKNGYNKPLHQFAVATALSTLALIALGGLVTSHGVGMSVPDWPTTYGYNMFLFPISKWVGGIFYEHTHRLLASVVGLLTIVQLVWIFLQEKRVWLKWYAVGSLVLVSMQGLLGGLRVVLSKDEIGVFHAIFAQLFFLMLCSIALFTSRKWMEIEEGKKPFAIESGVSGKAFWRWIFLGVTVLIFAQLIVGATMRHQHAGLAIPDFPLAYHKVWPDTDSASIAFYNSQRVELEDANPITAFQVRLQMAHRLMAFSILMLVSLCSWFSRKSFGSRHPLARISLIWLGLLFLQVILGAVTIWSNKAADIATGHVVVGALSLAVGELLTIIAFRALIPNPVSQTVSENREVAGVFSIPGKVGQVTGN